jgi:hypothetical protein
MAIKPIKRPRDPFQLAKLIGDIATGQIVDRVEDGKNEAAVARGKLGGIKGGKSRANKLSKKKRVSIAKKAINTRWKKKAAPRKKRPLS